MPTTIPVTVVVGEPGVVMMGVLGPLTLVHKPVPTAGELPASVTEVPHRVCGGPAIDGVTVFMLIGLFTTVLPHSFVTVRLILYAPGVA